MARCVFRGRHDFPRLERKADENLSSSCRCHSDSSVAALVRMILGALLGFLLAFVCAGYNWTYLWKLRKIPGPGRILPYYGNLLGASHPAFTHYTFLLKWPKLFGPVYKIFLGQRPYVVITDPHLIEQIGTRKFKNFHDRVPLPLGLRVTEHDKEQFNSNIMWASGKMWASVRSACEPLFHTSSLKSYVPLLHESIDEWLDVLAKQSTGGASVNIIHPMNAHAMCALGKATLGVDFDCHSEKQAQTPLVKAAFYNMDPPPADSTGVAIMVSSMTIPWLSGVLTWLIRHGWLGWEASKTFAEMEGYLNGSTRALIHNAKKASSREEPGDQPVIPQPDEKVLLPYDYHSLRGQAAGAAAYAHAAPREGTFVPRLLEAKARLPGQEPRALSDQEIVAQVYTLILAGYDSPANAMTHSLYELARNPAVQQHLSEEVDKLGGRVPGFEDLTRLPYTEAVFQEALRLHPVGNPMYSPCRVCTEDIELGGFQIPKGCGVMLNSIAMAHDPRWFPEPEKFVPERHIQGTPQIGPETRPQTAHIPFGYGPHGCIGRRFALLEAVFTLARFVQRFEVALDEKQHPPGHHLRARTGITLQPAGGIFLKIRQRNGRGAKQPEE